MNPGVTLKRTRTLRALDQRLGQLPVLPSVVSVLLSLDPQDVSFADRVEQLVRVDPPLAARILRFCNMFGRTETGSTWTVAGAISTLGALRIAETITSLAVMQVFVPSTSGQKDLWRHSIQVAVGARRLAEVRPDLEVPPEHAFLAGLLHDVGRFVMFQNSPRELGQVDEVRVSDPSQLVEAEVAICGYDHAELGWLACSRWGLPESINVLIRDHHVHDGTRRVLWPLDVERLNAIVQHADTLSFAVLLQPSHRERNEAARIRAAADVFRALAASKPLLEAGQIPGVLRDIESTSNALCRNLVELREQPDSPRH
jgi:putative nucleotidyltransferase with HDIG domain